MLITWVVSMFKEPENEIALAGIGMIGAVLLGLGFRWTAFSFIGIGLLAVFFVNRPLKK